MKEYMVETEICFNRIRSYLGCDKLKEFLSYDFKDLSCDTMELGGLIKKEFLKSNSTLFKLFIYNGVVDFVDMEMFLIRLFYVHMHARTG